MSKSEKVRTISMRMTDSTYAKVERVRSDMEKSLPGSKPSMSDAIRVLIERGLGVKS